MEEQVLVRKVLDSVLEKFTTPEYKEQLIAAKDVYFRMTGAVNDDDDDFESRMNLFNEWYLFEYRSHGQEKTYLQQYLESENISEDLVKSLLETNFSLFEYSKKNFRKQTVIEDFLRNEKFVLFNPDNDLGIVPKDIFIGRVVTLNEESFLLKGMCLLPLEVRSTLIKECKRLRKLKNPEEERLFLYNLENLKTKWRRYGHVDSNKIFVFEKK